VITPGDDLITAFQTAPSSLQAGGSRLHNTPFLFLGCSILLIILLKKPLSEEYSHETVTMYVLHPGHGHAHTPPPSLRPATTNRLETPSL